MAPIALKPGNDNGKAVAGTPTGFVVDGAERAECGVRERHADLLAQIATEVRAEYAEGVANARWWRRVMLRYECEREIDRRQQALVDGFAPPDALY
ncbi:MAG: hypothetical protein KDA63_19645 [Planctomycetales bacterium]|nr:hypothetical protein [Planctomycetales bacterium]